MRIILFFSRRNISSSPLFTCFFSGVSSWVSLIIFREKMASYLMTLFLQNKIIFSIESCLFEPLKQAVIQWLLTLTQQWMGAVKPIWIKKVNEWLRQISPGSISSYRAASLLPFGLRIQSLSPFYTHQIPASKR